MLSFLTTVQDIPTDIKRYKILLQGLKKVPSNHLGQLCFYMYHSHLLHWPGQSKNLRAACLKTRPVQAQCTDDWNSLPNNVVKADNTGEFIKP